MVFSSEVSNGVAADMAVPRESCGSLDDLSAGKPEHLRATIYLPESVWARTPGINEFQD